MLPDRIRINRNRSTPQIIPTMNKIACVLLLVVSCFCSLQAQKKGLYPTKDKTKLVLFVRDFAKKPIPKVDFKLQAANSSEVYEGRTNKKGYAELLVRNGRTYRISLEDSLNYDVLDLPAKAFQMTIGPIQVCQTHARQYTLYRHTGIALPEHLE